MTDYISTAEAAELLGVTVCSVAYWARHGLVKAKRFDGRTWMVSRKSLEKKRKDLDRPGRRGRPTVRQRAG